MEVKINKIDSWIHYLRVKFLTLAVAEEKEDQEENPVAQDQSNQYSYESLENLKLLFQNAFCYLGN